MSTFLNTTTNITAPYESCSYLGVESPPINNTHVACSIPDCEDNRAAIEKCCTGGSITTFNETVPVRTQNITINAEYLTCELDADVPGNYTIIDYDPNNPVFSLPDCIVREGGFRLVCNRPNSQFKGCLGPGGLQTPEGTGTGFATCGVNNENENKTALITSCCASSNGTLRAEMEGCGISCSGDETLEPCLKRGFATGRLGAGAGYGCYNRSRNSNDGAATLGASGKTTLASVLLAAVAAMAILH